MTSLPNRVGEYMPHDEQRQFEGEGLEAPEDSTGLTPSQRQILQQGGTVYGKTAVQWGVGMRFNTGKPPIWRGVINYFPRALEEVAFISEYGSKKYAWNNWQNIAEWQDNIRDSLTRHLVNQAKGREFDIDTELLEAGHLAWNALAYLELLKKEKEVANG